MRYKLVNHPYLVIDFSDFEAKIPSVFVDHIISFLIKKIPNLNKFEPSGNKTILFLDFEGSFSWGGLYVLGYEDGWYVNSINEISSDMFDCYKELLKLPDEEWTDGLTLGEKDCKKFVLLGFTLCFSIEYYDKNVSLEENKVKEEKINNGTFYSNYSYLDRKPQMIGHGLIGYYVPLWKKWWPKYNMWVIQSHYDLVSCLKYRDPLSDFVKAELIYFSFCFRVFSFLFLVFIFLFYLFLSKVLGYIILYI